MPMYEYECAKGHRFEKLEKFSASPSRKCPTCGAKAARQISASSMQFKGSGWYVTDYGGKSAAGDSAGKDKPAAADSKGDPKTPVKSDSKGDSKPSKSGDSKSSSSSSTSSSSTSSSSSSSTAKE